MIGGTKREALVGRSFGEFVVREALGSGGFGTVYRAEQPALAREAVIKVLHTRLLASETVVQRFLREARLASRLDHPYAAHTYAFGAEPDGTLWIAMEYVRGTPLDRLLEAQGPIPLERFVPLIERICEVVHTAHEQGIVHRDLKPANVMVLSRAGRLLPKLLDFGIAKLDDATPDLPLGTPPPSDARAMRPSAPPRPIPAGALDETAAGTDDTLAPAGAPPSMPDETVPTGRVASGARLASGAVSGASTGRLTNVGSAMGSPLYMAPEQWSDAGAVTARTDIYALGVLCYEALTGRTPFAGATQMQIAIAHAKQAPPPLGGSLPRELDLVIGKALAKEPADRHATALELAAAFRAASGVAAEPTSLPRLDDALRSAAMSSAPRPVALAIDALDGARNAHQARDALWRVVRSSVRLVGVAALASHTHVSAARSMTDPSIAEGLLRLRGRAMSDAAWLELARDLVRPFAELRDAHPIPELVELLTRPAGTALAELVALRAESDEAGGGTDDHMRELLERALPLLARAIEELALFYDYPLVVPVDDHAEEWMGVRRSERVTRAIRGKAEPGHAVLLDADGAPAVSLYPFVQVHEPSPGAAPALFFFEGKGRRGARMVALPDTFEREDEELWESLGAMLGETGDATRSGPAADEVSPFPGLAAFTSADARSFYGRERETEAFLNRLRVTPMLAVVGPSGAGKSSFVQAGVLPALPEGWRALTVRPGPAPLVTLAARLSAFGIDAQDLREEVAEHPGALGIKLRAHAGASTTSPRGTIVLVVDQLEELFTLCEDAREREVYADALVRAARSADDPIRVIVTLRDDFLLRAEALPALRSRLGQSLQLLTTPAPPDLKRILTEPIRRAGYEFDDPALPEEMVEAVAGAPGALALLSFTASKLWELRDRRFRQIAHKAYRSLGGVGGALAQHAEETLQAMPDEERRLVREVFRHAVTSEGTRAVLTRVELDQVLGGGTHAAAVVEKLIAARLLVASDSEGDSERIEITHEALLDAWPRLVTWRREDAEGARLRDQLRAAARQWDDRGRPSGLLWRGDALAEYRQWRARYPGSLTDTEEAFATASLADAARGRRLRRVLLAAGFVALAAVAVVLLFANARVERQRERAALGEAKAAKSATDMRSLLRTQYETQGRRLLLADDPLQALAYLHEAAELGASGAAHDFLVAQAVRATDGEIFRLRHDKLIGRVRFSADGTRVATAGYDNQARIWDARRGELVARLEHQGPVIRVDWSPDGRLLATASLDGTAAIFDAATGRRLHEMRQDAGAQAQAALFSPDGTLLLTVSTTDAVALWDVRTGALRATLNPPAGDPITPIGQVAAFAPDGTRVAAGDRRGAVRVWDVRSGRPVATLQASASAAITTVRFSPDGARIIAVPQDSTASIWDLRTRRAIASLAHDGIVNAAAFSPDGARVVTASGDRTAVVWDAATGKAQLTLGGHAGGVYQVAWSADATRIATASDDATMQLWDAGTGRRMARRVGHRGPIRDVQFDPAGRRIVTASLDGSAIVWSAEPTLRVIPLIGHTAAVRDASFAPSGAHVVTGGNDGTARIWDATTGREVLKLEQPDGLWTPSFSPDGQRVATGGERAVRLWDGRNGDLQLTLDGHQGYVVSITWDRSAAARLASASDDGTVRIWSAASGEPLRTIVPHGGAALYMAAFDPTGATLLTMGADGTARLWDPATGAQIRSFSDADLGRASAFDRTGKLLVSPTLKRSARIWRADTGMLVTELIGHMSEVVDARFSADAEFVVTASFDGTARIWDARTGDLLGILDHQGEQVGTASFSPDRTQIVTGVGSGRAMIWQLPRFDGDRAELSALLRCRVPYAVQGDRIVPREPDPAACAQRSAR